MLLPVIEEIRNQVTLALREDIGSGDVTAELIDGDAWADATVICRESAVLCGQMWFDEVFAQVDERVTVTWRVEEAGRLQRDSVVCELFGPARALLTGERTALNFLQTLSGTATQTRAYVDAIDGTKTTLLDTRKTLPGWRHAQKYAVVCGGGKNHRMGLYDAVLIKENHISAAGSIGAAVSRARTNAPNISIEVEVENLEQLEQALAARPERILLDNFSLDLMRQAHKLAHGKVPLEASGGIDLSSVRAIAETGVEFISVGGITKHVRAIDFSMRFAQTKI